MCKFEGNGLVPSAHRFERITDVPVARGLHIFRYVSAADGLLPPKAYVSATPESEGVVDVVCDPNSEPGVLNAPGCALVLRAARTAEIKVGLLRGGDGRSLEATFRLEALAADAPNAGASVASPESPSATQRNIEIGFLAHLAMRGDVICARGVWAGGPTAPAAIEGLEFRSNDPEALRIEAQVLSRNGTNRWSGWIPSGDFLGSRGRRQPISGLRLRLRGSEAARYELDAEALFLGATVTGGSGPEIEFTGPGGADPLVGLKLDLKSRARTSANGRVEQQRWNNSVAVIT